MMQKGRELSLAGHDVINLAGGDPDFDTPVHIQEAAFDAIRSGDTHYPTSHGTPELLEAICAKLARENGVEATPDRVIATPGGKWALYVVLMSILNPGDEVVILDPVWVSYDPMVRLTGGVPVHVALDHGDDFAVHKSALEAVVTEKTKLVMLNSPNNPTGYVMSMASMQAAAEVMQCYYVTGNADFIVILTARDMKDYDDFTRRHFFQNSNVRRFRTNVVMDSVKVTLSVPLEVGEG